ncbi:MAG: hypothetical protein AAFY60_00485, partial [Myxococcota bacterium]
SSEEQDKPPIGNRTLMFALIGTLVMASILAAYTLYLSQDPPRKTAVQKVKPLTQTQPQDVPTPNEVPDTDPPLNNTNDTVAPDPLPETSPDVVPPEPNKTTPKLPPREPAKVAKRLDEAETKLSAGQYRQSVRIAEQTLIVQPTARAHRIITESYCGMKDLGAARAAFYHVASADKRRISSACSKHDILLNPE